MTLPDPSGNLSDEELVVLTLKDKDNYECLVKRYEKKLARYVAHLSGLGREDAEDVLQEAFVKAYINLNDFDPRLKFSSWIYRITHNETVTHLRKKSVRPKTIDFQADFEIFETIQDDLDLLEQIDRKFLRENLNRLIAGLDKKYREPIILKFLEEKNYQEISDILKIPMGSVATLISRGKKQLREGILAKKKNERPDFFAWLSRKNKSKTTDKQIKEPTCRK